MNRRDFLKTTAAAGGAALAAGGTAAGQEADKAAIRQYYELRLYHLRRGPKTELFDRFFRNAALPALNRAGIERVGVFSVMVGPESPTQYVLLAHPSLDSVVMTHKHLEEDAEFRKAGAEFLDAPASDPAYERVESSLMIAFESMPKLEVPAFGGGGKGRFFEPADLRKPQREGALQEGRNVWPRGNYHLSAGRFAARFLRPDVHRRAAAESDLYARLRKPGGA